MGAQAASSSSVAALLRGREAATSHAEHRTEPPNKCDAAYSSRLFHGADGNLFGVLSPVRSQRTRPPLAQADRRRGRCRSLKFHNFVPSDRDTTEWRLREEHGTKQIAVASRSAPLPCIAPDVATPLIAHRSAGRSPAAKQASLRCVVSALHSRPAPSAFHPPPFRHTRRKPAHTRRLLPYAQFLKLVDETRPLDLSAPRPPVRDMPTSSPVHSQLASLLRGPPPQPYPSPEAPPFRPSLSMESTPYFSGEAMSNCASSTMPTRSEGDPSSRRESRMRGGSGRAAVRQRLEAAFRANGFLVQTKQVSDGDATFCKFRQLRKYTRYYLKSWQHHLPDEVHKMWKGFLPPKTRLPPTPPHNP